MQVSLETTSTLERRLTIGVPASEVDKEVNDRLQKAAKTIRLDGFRRGKVPMKIVRQRFGKGVRSEVLGELVNRTFYDAVTSENLRPAGQPAIEPIKDEPGKDFEYLATFEVYPEIELVDLSTIFVASPEAEVSEGDVDKMIDVLRKQQARWEAVQRPAIDGDRVNIDYVGTREGDEFEGGKAEESYLVLGSNQMIPGFEEGIFGLSAGEEKTLELAFPDDYHVDELKGAAVAFAVKVNEVQEQQLPELNDEFYALYGVKEGGEEAFRKEVRSNMERELKNATANKIKTRVMDQLYNMHRFDLPKALVDNELFALKQQMIQQFGGGQKFDPSLLPDDMFREQAERRVALGLIIAEVVKSANLEVDKSRVREKIEEIASTYEEPEEVVNYYYSQSQLLSGLESAVLEEQVIDYLLESATVSIEPCSYEAAVKPDPKPEKETAASG